MVGRIYEFKVFHVAARKYYLQANPSSFTPGWNTTFIGAELIPTDPPCGCGYIRNHEEVEGRIAFIDRGDCSFVSKAGFGKISYINLVLVYN